jgi:AbiV family abortive infection protein
MNTSTARKLTRLSLENAEQWLKDAKLLINKGSYGHANAALRFSAEESVKALVCWQVQEKIMPKDSKLYRDVFKSHVIKNQVIIGFLFFPKPNMKELTDREFLKWWDEVEEIPELMEEKRKLCIYVNYEEDGRISAPLEVGKNETEVLRKYVEVTLGFVRNIEENATPESKKRLKDAYASWPKDVWETGEIPREYLNRISEVLSHE